MESLLAPARVTFTVLRTRLIEQVKYRIDNGEFTERGLARILGISQSQTHNVLKGARTLQMQLADRILAKLGLSTMDLFSGKELDAGLRAKMAEWDRQMAADEEKFGLTEFELDLAGQSAPRKPARSESHSRRRRPAKKAG